MASHPSRPVDRPDKRPDKRPGNAHRPAPAAHDVVVVGGRCAGSAVARLLAARGHDVVVLERAPLPSDTLSTHNLARGGVVQLARWGLLAGVLADGAPAVRQVRFAAGGSTVVRPVKDRAGVDLLLAPRRARLDLLLVRAAADAGAQVRTGVAVTGLLRDGRGRVGGVTARTRDGRVEELRARYVVGADGVRSLTAAAVQAPTVRAFDHHASTYYAYVGGVPWPALEFHVGPRAYAGAFPTHDGLACVWLCRPTSLTGALRHAGRTRPAAFVRALDELAPDLGARVRAGRLHGPVRGWDSPPNRVRRAHGPGWSLVGDAGYYRDPVTGQGMTDAFRDAELLADALDRVLTGTDAEAAALAAYERERDAALAETLRLTEQMTRFPEPDRFTELAIELGEAVDREALRLASQPTPNGVVPPLMTGAAR
ncbi:NAD(P)/FAD-dependent oxidoreductase [Nocardioides sp. TF02-7]|uniref:NAD(P)/FAD-dependent oxidoreductase n=1 Tax=Nocardioides sp. TF02-7 TaxID=2917724 RepID=UPI001F064764|nr:NAD(P)/FAD-dependent oxidoreductase [Nocardioides sp. TF02-7]UMG91808.1 NAD(P)/FAD-dependent oxidoreductase [Nocardioides sp. TF02-7]